MKYFGTDGIRGIPLESLTDEIIEKFAKAVSIYIRQNNLINKIVIAKDSRKSSDYIIMKLSAIFLLYGIDIFYAGIAPTPCLAILTKRHFFAVGIMISASHNPEEYNGIKLFNSLGRKFNENDENVFENLMDCDFEIKHFNYGKFINAECYVKEYVDYAQKLITNIETPLIIDCANGASSQIIPQIFSKNKNITFIGNNIEANINDNCGCTNIQKLSEMCKANKKIGIAYDGDADRVIMVDEKGKIIDGDHILFIIATARKDVKVVVGTIMTNYGLEQSLKNKNIQLVRQKVGDKFIAEYIYNNNLILGGEQAGHTIIADLNETGDGILTSIFILNLLKEKTFDELLKDYFEYPQITKNVKIDKKTKIKINKSEKLINFISEIEEEMHGEGRIVIRTSGTEDILRIMLESNTEIDLILFLSKIKKYLHKEFDIKFAD